MSLQLEGADGTLETIVTTLEHPFYVQGRGFVAAGKLKTGMKVSQWQPRAPPVQTVGHRKADTTGHLLVKAITITRLGLKPWRAYNLSVENDHTFFVGKQKAWVHNAGDCLPTAGEWKNGTPGNGDWYPDNPKVKDIIGNDPIPFIDGYPNFDKWEIDRFTGLDLPKTRHGDVNIALDLVAKKQNLVTTGTVTQQRSAARNWLRNHEPRLAIHHPPGGNSLQLIPFDLNKYVKHKGGYSD